MDEQLFLDPVRRYVKKYVFPPLIIHMKWCPLRWVKRWLSMVHCFYVELRTRDRVRARTMN